MLVLTRKVGEQIVIGGDIRVTVSAIKGDRVKCLEATAQFFQLFGGRVRDRLFEGLGQQGT